jgi:hypothetical protein
MPNVVKFRPKASNNRATDADPTVSMGASGLPRSTARELGRVILLLDLAAQHVREIAAKIHDPGARQAIDDYVTSIEVSLQAARDRTLQL